MKRVSYKLKSLIILVLTLGFIMAFTACEKSEPEPYVSKREGKRVETPFNTMTEALIDAQEEDQKMDNGLSQVNPDQVGTEGIGKAIVNTRTLNVRSLPNQDSEIITQLTRGTEVTVLSTLDEGDTNWVYIQNEGISGYVMTTYLEW